MPAGLATCCVDPGIATGLAQVNGRVSLSPTDPIVARSTGLGGHAGDLYFRLEKQSLQ